MRITRYLILFLLVGCLALFGIFFTFFFRRLTAGDFQPYLESKLSEWLQIKTELGRISLTWQSGLGLEVNDLRLRNGAGGPPILATDSVFLLLDPFSVFRQKIVFYEFKILRPRVLLVTDRNGKNNWEKSRKPTGQPLSVPKGGGNLGSKTFKGIGGLAFLFSRAKLEEGDFLYRDETKSPPMAIELKGINATAGQAIPGGVINLEGEWRILDNAKVDLGAQITLNPRTGETHFENQFQGDRMTVEGEAFLFQKPVRFRSKIQTSDLNLDTLYRLLGVPEIKRGVSGVSNGHLEVQGLLTSLEGLKKNLQGNGRLEIRDGAFRNVNVADSVLRRITIVPAIQEILTGALPAPLQRILGSRDTPFELLQIGFTIQDNQAVIHPLFLKNPYYLLQVEGTVGLNGEMNLAGNLILLEELSRFLVGRVHELSSLENSQGRMVIPFIYRGQGVSARPRPDLAYLARQLVVEQGTRLVEKGLDFLSQFGKQPPSHQEAETS